MDDVRLKITTEIIIALINHGKVDANEVPEQFRKIYQVVDDCYENRFNRERYNSPHNFGSQRFRETKSYGR